jgi:hypothetical protein
MLELFKNLKKSTKTKLMISLLSFTIATISLFCGFCLIAGFGYFFGGCLIGDSLADETN